jgi:hypothetical protein
MAAKSVSILDVTRLPADATRLAVSRAHRLEQGGWITSKWEAAPDRQSRIKYYRLTETCRKQLVVEESEWKQMAQAVARLMWAAGEAT